MRVYGFTAYGCGFMEIENSLEAKQAFVGGYIEVVDIGNGIDLICNEEGKLNGMMPTAGWFERGRLVDLICGPFILCRSNWEGDFVSIREEDEDLMEWFDISRTTLWRWKKELKEWEQQGKF